MGEIVEDIFPRSDIDANVVPFLRGDFGEAALHQRLAGRDDLHHGGMALLEIPIDGRDKRRRLHAGEQMAEKALLGAFKGRARRGFGLPVQCAFGAGDIGGLHRGVEIVVDDGEGPGIGVVDAALFVGELVLDEFIFDAVIG